ncbi:NUDIX hydrolase [Streptomyces sp. NPDC046374]|uniref:NUDIX hydrolase n=1 Tax=Streptomyces sp. NPDC046374 TaxID=3154917 RepID=UPI00340790C0
MRVALFDETDRVLLPRHAAGRTPGLWDLPYGTIFGREHPEDAARRVVTERTGLACTEVTEHTAVLSGTSTAHHVFFARAAATETPAGLPPAYDGHVWRYADAPRSQPGRPRDRPGGCPSQAAAGPGGVAEHASPVARRSERACPRPRRGSPSRRRRRPYRDRHRLRPQPHRRVRSPERPHHPPSRLLIRSQPGVRQGAAATPQRSARSQPASGRRPRAPP